MKTAAGIVVGDHNKEKLFISHNARVFWDNVNHK